MSNITLSEFNKVKQTLMQDGFTERSATGKERQVGKKDGKTYVCETVLVKKYEGFENRAKIIFKALAEVLPTAGISYIFSKNVRDDWHAMIHGFKEIKVIKEHKDTSEELTRHIEDPAVREKVKAELSSKSELLQGVFNSLKEDLQRIEKTASANIDQAVAYGYVINKEKNVITIRFQADHQEPNKINFGREVNADIEPKTFLGIMQRRMEIDKSLVGNKTVTADEKDLTLTIK